MRYSGRNLKSSASPYLNRGGAKNSRPLQKLDSMANASKPVFSISLEILRYLESGGKNADEASMSIALINNLSRYRQSALGTALQDTGLTTNTTGNNLNGIDSFSVGLQPDNGQLSPFAQLLNTLQQLQQSDPTKYQQVAQQIATNLQTAAQTAQTDGNTTAASRLYQLAADFTNASQNGQLPNIQDLAQAIGGHHHHYHIHSPSADSGSDPTTSSSSSSASSTSSSSSTSQSLDQFLAAFEASGTQNGSFNPMAIILDTLSNSGTSISNARSLVLDS